VSIYGRVVTAGYDRFMARPEPTVLRQHRRSLLRAAGGNVLEIGAGTGANVPFYTDAVETVMTEPEAPMARKLERRPADAHLPVGVVQAPAERMLLGTTYSTPLSPRWCSAPSTISSRPCKRSAGS